MHLSSINLSNLQLKSSLNEITVSYAAVRLSNSTGILLSLKKSCQLLTEGLDPGLTFCIKTINWLVADVGKRLQFFPRGRKVDKFVNNFLGLLQPSLSFKLRLQALFRRFSELKLMQLGKEKVM